MITLETKALGILARWYAEPLTHEQAQALLTLSQQREQALLKRHGKSYLSPLLKLIALHWLDKPIEGHYHHLISKRGKSVHAEILKLLLYGQLLMSKRKAGATDYLAEAFEQARLLLRPEDYFDVVKRHKLLKVLPTEGITSKGESLEALLKTAGVIEKMKQSHTSRPGFSHDPNDTYG